MHNNIMTTGSRDRPSMLATGRYPQWRSRFLRYLDTRPNGEALRKCILSVEKPINMTPENKAHFKAEKEAIHLILTGIGNEIYSTVDACQTAQEMWEANERLQQGESLNIQDVKTNLFWEFEEKVDTSQALDASSVDTECSRTELKEQDTSSRSGNDAHNDDANVRPIYDEEPMAEVQTTAEIDVFAIRQHHT
nr:hypothetical protein [Tanacetum cinerariifolium]